MNNEIKQAIEKLSASLVGVNLAKLKSAYVLRSINACIAKMPTNKYTDEQRITKITAHLVKYFKLLTIEDTTVTAPIVAQITTLVTQIINQSKPSNATSTTAPAPTTAPETPVRRESVVAPASTTPIAQGSKLFQELQNTPKMQARQKAYQGSPYEASDDEWAVAPKPRASLSNYAQPSTPVESSPPKPRSSKRKTIGNGRYVLPMPLSTAVNVTSEKDIQKLKKIKEQATRVEAQLEAQQASERQALSTALPKMAVVVPKTTQPEKKQMHSAADTPKTSPAKHKTRPKRIKCEQKLAPLQEKIDFENIYSRLKPSAAKTKAATGAMAQQQAPETVEQPQFSTSPPVASDTSLSPVHASPTTNLNHLQQSAAARHTPHPVSSPLVWSEFFSSADSTPEQRSAKKQKLAEVTPPTQPVAADPFVAPSPRPRTPHTQATRHTPNNHVSPSVVVVPPAEIPEQMEGTPLTQRFDSIGQPQQSPLRQPNFLAVDDSPVLRFSPVNRRQSPRLQQTPAPENAAVVPPVAAQVASPRVPTPTRSPVAQAPSPRRVSGAKRKSMEPVQQPVPVPPPATADAAQRKRACRY